jgi:catechol 2,3-dioxygenase-like lactoylglutathione lyase family enzyme
MVRLTGTVLDAPDAQALGDFYHRLLGWAYAANEPGWVKLVPPDGGAGLSFQEEPLHRRPTWPSRTDAQQMQLHLDIEVDDLDAEVARALAEGATLADFQPQEHVRVLLDPVGHPFCLWVAEG